MALLLTSSSRSFLLLLAVLLLSDEVLQVSAAAAATAPSLFSPSSTTYSVEEHIFQATVDHYNFRYPRTFDLRYYVNEEYWNNATTNSSSVLFYAGNEADIHQFIRHSGFLFEVAEELGAMVVFAEHRYYGESNPSSSDLSYLTVEQAMADFNTLTVHIRQKWSMPASTAFIAVGGSYGGNLALWLRLKNPNLWAGALASSATPLKHVLRQTNGFARIETEAYGNVSSVCPDLVRAGWKELYQQADTEEGRAVLVEALGLCDGGAGDFASTTRIRADRLHGWISEALETMVQYGYPYPTNFYNPVPAYPFAVACRRMLDAGTGLGALRAAVDVYYNYTGQAGACYDYRGLVKTEWMRHWQRKGDLGRLVWHDDDDDDRKDGFFDPPILLQPEVHGESSRRTLQKIETKLSVAEAWGFQTCTEVYQPMPTDGVTDFEVPHTPNQTAYYAHCWKRYGVHPRPDWEEMTFMGDRIQSGSNIFLSHGQLDPWRAAGIQNPPKGSSSSIIVRTIEHGAHHYDLRASHPSDPASVVNVRNEEKAAMRRWIEEWQQLYQTDDNYV